MVQRVLMTADAVGGVWTYAYDLCRQFQARQVEILLAVMGPAPSADKRAAIAQLPHVSLQHRPYALEWMQDASEDVATAGRWLLALEKSFHPDVCHINGYAHAALPFSAPRLLVAHSCVYSWWAALREGQPGTEWRPYGEAVRRALATAEAVVAPSAWMLDQLRLHYAYRGNGTVIQNGMEASGFQPKGKQPFVFAAGRLWDEAKNFTLLDEVAAELRWPTFVAGPDAGLTFRHCQTLGEIEQGEMQEWMGRASIYAFPTKYEPFGLSILEAACCECALVLGDLPSLREIWGDAALYVDPRDVIAVRAAINRLIESADLRQALGAAARQRATRYSGRRQSTHYLNTYAALTTADRNKRCASSSSFTA